MQYWINHRGVQSGPVDLDALKEMGLTSAAYVWHEGLPDWVKITQLPELQGLYVMENGTTAPQPQQATVAAEPQAQEEGQTVMGQPYQPYQQQPYQQQPQYAQPQASSEPCPPTNLAWAIISMILCCIPTGIVAIVYALKVTNKYREGDIEGAKRASETSAWWCIATIVLGIIIQPFMSLLPALMGSLN
jgi:hypothetical protein